MRVNVEQKHIDKDDTVYIEAIVCFCAIAWIPLIVVLGYVFFLSE